MRVPVTALLAVRVVDLQLHRIQHTGTLNVPLNPAARTLYRRRPLLDRGIQIHVDIVKNIGLSVTWITLTRKLVAESVARWVEPIAPQA